LTQRFGPLNIPRYRILPEKSVRLNVVMRLEIEFGCSGGPGCAWFYFKILKGFL
jgi:hypothetical protein